MSSALSPKIIPVKPPVIKVETVPIANNIAVVNLIFPFHSVVKKLKTLTADGIAMSNVVNVNTEPKNGSIPVKNI